MSIVVGTGKNARVRLNTGELQNRKEAEKKTETPAEGTDIAKGKEETSKADTLAEGADGNENQTEE